MESDIAISVKNVSKAYTIWRDPTARLKHPLLNLVGDIFPAWREKIDFHLEGFCTEFYALKEVSFEGNKEKAEEQHHWIYNDIQFRSEATSTKTGFIGILMKILC